MMMNVTRSLTELLGEAYMSAVRNCAISLNGMAAETAEHLAGEPVSFFSQADQERQDALLARTGTQFIPAFDNTNHGAPTDAFGRAANRNAAPVGGFGIFRVGEDGKLYMTAKSEHYHTSLGHGFGGYKLLNTARLLGIPNATHNNTRGYITRLMERELIRTANSLPREDPAALDACLHSTEPRVLNRVINLETGSLAVEAGIKMMLNRFSRLDKTFGEPTHAGKTPVLLVMADNEDGPEANYHGTTLFAQILRGMWPDLRESFERNGIFKTVSVRINDLPDFERKIRQYNRDGFRTAGFLHEIILMNYGGIRLSEAYLRGAYQLCREYETPTLVDEIQSCMWYMGMFLYKLYHLEPDFVILGKGFPGGEYPASKIITTHEMDNLNLFGALVTNGQEELASLAYLITMEFAQENAEEIERRGIDFETRLRALAGMFPSSVAGIGGQGHLAAIHFKTVDMAVKFSKTMNSFCIDVSAQTYKANCPPAALLKLPLVTSRKAMDYLLEKMEEAMKLL